MTIQIERSGAFETVGWVEVKLPKDNIGDTKFDKQFDKYKDSLENIIFTNLRQWELWQWNDKKTTNQGLGL